jgi:hypothetical protein
MVTPGKEEGHAVHKAPRIHDTACWGDGGLAARRACSAAQKAGAHRIFVGKFAA